LDFINLNAKINIHHLELHIFNYAIH
jgi:hypothetical protein